MSLDDLLTSAREHREVPDRGRLGIWVVVRILAGSAVVAFAADQVLLVSGFRVPYPLLLAVLVAVLVARRITAAAHGTPAPPVPAPPRRWRHESPHDQAYAAARRWISRLGGVEVDRDAFDRRVRPAIVALIDERLRLRHGVDRRRDPQRARALLADELWRFVTESTSRPPKPQHLVALTEQIEKL